MQALVRAPSASGPSRRVIVALALLGVASIAGWLLSNPAQAQTAGATCTQSSAVYVCALPTTGQTSVDVASLVSQLGSEGITSGTPIWIQAWGGQGGMGGGYNTGSRASGGSGGFTQTVATLDQLESTYGTSTLYYYTGDGGLNHGSSSSDNPGGDGGASSVVASADLSSATPSIDVENPAQGNVLLLAAGGGGGAGENQSPYDVGDSGGDGGVAVAATSKSIATPGGQGTDKTGTVSDHSGQGGQCPGGGAKGTANAGNGAWGTSGVGGTGGGGGQTSSGHYSPTGWTNSTDTELAAAGSGGHGAPGVYVFPYNAGAGGGGGGGWGGGGGGGAASSESSPGAGGGGCSFAAEDLTSDPLAPIGGQSNPTGDAGYVQLVFDPVNSTATFDVPTPASPGDSGTFTARYTTAAGSSTKTFYAAGGTLVGAWDGADQTLTSGSGQVDLEDSAGKPLPEVVTINQGASITPVSGGTDCDGEDQWLLSGSVTINNVPHFGTVTGDADLTGCGEITGEVTYNGALSDLKPNEIDWVTVSNLDLDMDPATVVKAAPRQRVHKPIYARVGCLDQSCRIRLKGLARIHDHGQVKRKGVEKKVIRVKKGHVRRVHLRFKHQHQRSTSRLRRKLSHGQHAQLRVRVKSSGTRGPVDHSRLRIKLRP